MPVFFKRNLTIIYKSRKKDFKISESDIFLTTDDIGQFQRLSG